MNASSSSPAYEEQALEIVGRIVRDRYPEDSVHWETAGAPMARKWLTSGKERVQPATLRHVPGAAPDWAEVAKWIQLTLGCVNGLLSLAKHLLDRQQAKAKKNTEEKKEKTEEVDPTEEIIRRELEAAGVTPGEIEALLPQLMVEFRELVLSKVGKPQA